MGCTSSTLLKEVEADVLPVKRHLRSSYAHKGPEHTGLGSDSHAGALTTAPAQKGTLHDVLLLYSNTGSAWVAGLQEVLESEHNFSVLGPSEQARASCAFTRVSTAAEGLGEICPVKEGGRCMSGAECVVLSPSQMTTAAAQTKLGTIVLVTAGSTWDDALTACIRHTALRAKPLVLLHIPESCPAPNPSDWPADIQHMLLTRKIPMLTYISSFSRYGAGQAVAALQQQLQASQQPQQAAGAGAGSLPGIKAASPMAARNQSPTAASVPRTPVLQQHTSLSLDSKQPSGEMGASSATLTGTSTDSRSGMGSTGDSAKSSSSEACSRATATAMVSVSANGTTGKAAQPQDGQQPDTAVKQQLLQTSHLLGSQNPWQWMQQRLLQQGWGTRDSSVGPAVQRSGAREWDVVLAIHHPKFYPVAMQVAQALSPFFSIMVVDGSLATAGLNGVSLLSKPMRQTLHSMESANQRLARQLVPALAATPQQGMLTEQTERYTPFAMEAGLQQASLAVMPAPLVKSPSKLPAMPASPPGSDLEAPISDISSVHLTIPPQGTEPPVLMQELAVLPNTSQQGGVHATGVDALERYNGVNGFPTVPRARSGRTVMHLSPLQSGKLLHVDSMGSHMPGTDLPSMPRHVRSVSMGSSAWPLQLQLHSSGSMAAAASAAVAAAALPAPVAVSGSAEAAAAVASCRHYITFVGYHLGTASDIACREAIAAMQAKAMLHVVCEASFNMLSPDVSAWAHTEQQAQTVRAAWSSRLMYYPDHMDPFLAELASRCAAEPTTAPTFPLGLTTSQAGRTLGGNALKSGDGTAPHSTHMETQVVEPHTSHMGTWVVMDGNSTAKDQLPQQQDVKMGAQKVDAAMNHVSQLRMWGSQPLPAEIRPQ